jgi:GrpB-like predicted nucleotidyltransferase (UPF0157 family)
MSSVPEALDLSPWSPMWPVTFEIERERLKRVFVDNVQLEHIGATAVEAMGGRPIIDVLLGAPQLSIVETRIPELMADGYRNLSEVELAAPQRRFLVKTHGHPGHFHLHAVVLDSVFWKQTLAFRDVLRASPTLADEYMKAKRRILTRYPTDRAKYTEAKSAFIRTVLEKGK